MSLHLLITCNARAADLQLDLLDTAIWQVVSMGKVAVPGAQGPGDAAPMARLGNRLWLGWRGPQPQLIEFAIDTVARGLHPVGAQPVADSLCHLSVTADGRHLLAAGGRHGSVFAIRPNPGLNPPLQRLELGSMAHCLVAEGNIALATACRDDRLLRMGFDAETGQLSPQDALQFPAGSGPRHVVIEPGGARAHVLLQEGGAVVTVKLGPNMTVLQHLPIVAAGRAAMSGEITLLPSGDLLVTERESNRLIRLAPDSQTRLPVIVQQDMVSDYPRALGVGQGFVCSLGFRGDRAVLHQIGADGALRRRLEFPTGARPSWVVAVPLP